MKYVNLYFANQKGNFNYQSITLQIEKNYFTIK